MFVQTKINFYLDLQERTIDLQCVQREAMEIAQRGITSAKIVHMQLNAHVAQLPERGYRFGAAVEPHTLGELEPQRSRVETDLAQDGLHLVDEVGLSELRARDVDTHR